MAAAYVLLGAALFGTVGIAKELGPDAPNIQVAWLRVLLASLVFGAFAWRGRGLREAWGSESLWIAGLAQAAFQIAIFTAFSRIGVGGGTLIGIGLAPLITGILKRAWSWVWALSTALGLAGLGLLVGGGSVTDVRGIVAGLCAATALSVYIIAIGRPSSGSPQAELSAIFGVAALALAIPAVLASGGDWLSGPSGWVMIVYIALVPTVLAYRLYNSGGAFLPASMTATFGLMEPVIATVLGVIVLDEAVTVPAVIGAVLIVSAVLVLVRMAPAPVNVRDNG
ncbi:hypothetical protein BH09ACT10_BH09ACT10_29310 [soil metagenome]